MWLLLELPMVLAAVAVVATFREALFLCTRFSMEDLMPLTIFLYLPLATSAVWQPSNKVLRMILSVSTSSFVSAY